MCRLILALGGVLAVFVIGGTLDLASPADVYDANTGTLTRTLPLIVPGPPDIGLTPAQARRLVQMEPDWNTPDPPEKDTCPSAADIAHEIAEQGDKLFSCVPTLQCPPAGPSLTQGKCRKCITKAGRWWCRGCALDFAE